MIDCDVGQPEFTPSGLISLHIISSNTLTIPILSPPHLHLHPPQLAYFVGEVSIKHHPEIFENAIRSLYSHYLLLRDYYSLNGYIPQNVADSTSTHPTITSSLLEEHYQTSSFSIFHENSDEKYDRYSLPLVINTDGMVRGMGIEILRAVMETMRPTHILHLQNPKDKFITAIDDYQSKNPGQEQAVLCQLTPGRSTPSRLSAQDLRELRSVDCTSIIYLSVD